MGLRNFMKRVKPTKKKVALMKKQYDEGRILSVNTGRDNKQLINQIMNEANNAKA